MTETTPVEAVSTTRRARIGVLAALVSRIFGRLVGLVLVVVLARVADAQTVAVYGFLLGTVTLMASVTDLGVASLAGRDVASRVAVAPQALRSAVGPQTAAGGLAVVLTCTVALLAGPDGIGAAVLVPCSAFVVLNALFNLWGEVLRGDSRVVLEGVLQGVSAVLLVAAGTVAVLAGADVVALFWIVAAKELVVLLVAVACSPPARRVVGGIGLRALLRRSLWLAAAGTALVLLWRQGTLLVSAGTSTRELADYVVATRFLDAAVTIAHTVGIGLFPALAVMRTDDPPGAVRYVRRCLLLATAGAVPLAVLGVLLAGPVTTGVFGEQWVTAVGTVRVLALGAPAILLGYLLWFALLAAHEERWLCLSAVASAVGAVAVTAVLLGAGLGAAAGAWGTGAGALVLLLLLLARARVTARAPATTASA